MAEAAALLLCSLNSSATWIHQCNILHGQPIKGELLQLLKLLQPSTLEDKKPHNRLPENLGGNSVQSSQNSKKPKYHSTLLSTSGLQVHCCCYKFQFHFYSTQHFRSMPSSGCMLFCNKKPFSLLSVTCTRNLMKPVIKKEKRKKVE